MGRRPDSGAPRGGAPYDIVIIGGGSAGLTGARVAAALGARVAMVEREPQPGGDCLWTGCVPSKAFISAARRAHDVRTSSRFGITSRVEQVSFAGVMEHVRSSQRSIAPADSRDHLGYLGVEVFLGHATIGPGNQVSVEDAGTSTRIRARHVLVATGSSPIEPPIPGIEQVRTVTTDSFWSLGELPQQLLVLGGGSVGCELGQACARLGSTVTIVEACPVLLPGEEPAASEAVTRSLLADGVTVMTRSGVVSFAGDRALLEGGGQVRFDACLLAVGRQPNAAPLFDPPDLHVATGPLGHILVDPHQRTSRRRVWAAGDVTGQLALTSAAGLQGANAVLNALLRMRRSFDATSAPRVTFTDPEVGRVGLTATEARQRHPDVEELVVPLEHVDRAVVTGRVEGELRLVTGAGGRLLGATCIGESAGEQLALLGTFLGRRAAIPALARVQHAYPTLGEASRNAAFERQLTRAATPAARRLLGRAIPVLSRLS